MLKTKRCRQFARAVIILFCWLFVYCVCYQNRYPIAISLESVCSEPLSDKKRERILPKNDYVITVHSELGMHCTSFDLSYCCVLPPYNSILAQIVKTERKDHRPVLLDGEYLRKENLVLWYEHERNSYSEGEKLLYWNVPYDVNNNGKLNDPVDSFANAEFAQLYTSSLNPFGFDYAGTLERVYIGLNLNIPIDHGMTGKPLSFGSLHYSIDGTILYTVINDRYSWIPIPLSMKGYWEAIGLPLTPFFDGSVGAHRRISEDIIRPYQIAKVTLAKWNDKNGDGKAQMNEVTPQKHRDGRKVTFFGVNSVDLSSCDKCHASEGANKTENDEGEEEEFTLWRKEYDYWKNTYPDTTDYYARQKALSISILEIHDKRHETDFLKNYDPENKTGAPFSRLGRTSIKCQSCHADNILGVLVSNRNPKEDKPISALSKAVHLRHLRKNPQTDVNKRAANCQLCHPQHWQSGRTDYIAADAHGKFKGGDIRDKWGGCYPGRDVHSNPKVEDDAPSPSHLNAVGKWLKENVANDGKGLYCTNCHNLGSRLLYKADRFIDAVDQTGETLRNKNLEQIIAALKGMEGGKYKDYTVEDFFDPKLEPVDRVSGYWNDSTNPPYDEKVDSGDSWLSAGEPHCADCHLPPFVEGIGGNYFPIDQEEKYSLMRYSKGHSGISCQSCHGSTHALFPVNPDGPDPTSYRQAAQLNPDGSHGPVKCGACHEVDAEGVPNITEEENLNDFSNDEYPTRYDKAVAHAHTWREQSERTMEIFDF